MLPSDLRITIFGGNRMVPFTQPIDVYADALDPGVLGDVAAHQGISCFWGCKNLNNGLQCFQTDGDLLNLTKFNGMKEIHILPKRLEPYISFVFTFTCTKFAKTNEASISVIITEIDLPALAVDIPPSLSQARVNLNQEIIFRLNYSGTSPDNLFYSGALVYDYDVVSTMVFQYLDFKFKIWDYFTSFTNVSDKLTIRCSVYDPRFYMPSYTSLEVAVNIPPQNCRFTVTPSSGIEYFTAFSLAVSDCVDENFPLQYKFSFYLSDQLYYEDIVNGTTTSQNLLLDYRSLSTLDNTQLPFATQRFKYSDTRHPTTLQ